MHSQKEFDEIIKNKMDSQEFPFDEANWEKAAAMIDASRKGKNRAGLWIFSTLIVLTCGLIGVYTFTNIFSSDNEQTAQNTNTAKINAEQLGNSVVLPTITDTQESKPEEINSNTSVNTESKAISESENKTNTNKIYETTKTASSKNSVGLSKTSTAGSNENTNLNTSSSANANINLHKVEKKTFAEKKVLEEKTTKPIVKTSDPNNSAIAKETKTPENGDTKTKILSDLKPIAATPIETEKTTSLTPAAEKTELAVAAVDTSAKELAKTPKIDTASVAEAAKPIVVPPLIKNYVAFEAGADYLLGWENPGSTDANGFNPIVGINYTHFFNKRIGFTIGAQYNTVGNLSYSNHTSMVTSYTFGQENDVTVITPVRLHYVVAPLKFNFAFNPKNIIGVGCNIAYLMSVDNKVDTYNERLNYTSEHSVSKTKGYVSGIKNFDTQLSVFYRKTIYKELSVNAELLYGLTDIKDNTFFNSNMYERNVGFKLTLQLNVFKK